MSRTPNPDADRSKATAAGPVLFAAVMFIVAEVLGPLRGIMAITRDEVFVSTPDHLFAFGLTS
ncbi:DUF7144 family membrane protein [Streptomyces sp. HB2AG]|uniref:DUF7144 family membrane protein n=1 Tax=Streptomyces sp. HB2AG TaxID=2983400 RepID=UPI002E7B1C87|nr:hypothetical protein [Streptomyces sp. HB2AG]